MEKYLGDKRRNNDLCGIVRHRSYSSFDDGWSRLEQLFLAVEFVCGSGLPGGAGGIVFFAEKALFRALGHVVQSGDSFTGNCVGPYILYGYD